MENAQKIEDPTAPVSGAAMESVGERPSAVEERVEKPNVNGNGHLDPRDGYALRRIEKLDKGFNEVKGLIQSLVERLDKGQTDNRQATPAEPQTDPYANLEKYTQDTSQKVARDIFQEEYGKIKEKERLENALAVANKYVHSQTDISEDDYEDVAKLALGSGLYPILMTNPDRFAKNAVELWRESKGLKSPGIDKTSAKQQAGGVTGGSPGGKKTWTRSEIADLI